jgi:hypothetical protein
MPATHYDPWRAGPRVELLCCLPEIDNEVIEPFLIFDAGTVPALRPNRPCRLRISIRRFMPGSMR